jgi:thiol-disulfide isomerase/thioredoxin
MKLDSYVKFVKLNSRIILILSIITIFTIAGLYIYNSYIAPKLKPSFVANKEFKKSNKVNDNDIGNNKATMYYFYADWCPHCNKATPHVDSIIEKYENKPINGYHVIFKKIDCSDTNNVPNLANEYNVEGYPTIKLNKGNGNIIDFNARPTKDTLEEFLGKTL